MVSDEYKCSKYPNSCTYTSNRLCTIKNHMKICTNEIAVISKQVALGKPNRILDELIQLCYLTEDFRNYRIKKFCVYDIETLEESKKAYDNIENVAEREPEAYLKVVSIATASNIACDQPKYFERRSSAPKDQQVLINEFMDHLFHLHSKFAETIPKEIKESLLAIEEKIKTEMDLPKKKRNFKNLLDFQRYRRHLLSYSILNIYGFNSGKNFLINDF